MKTAVAEAPRLIAFHELETIHSPENGVQIWLARLDSISPEEMKALRATLDSTERARAARFHFEDARRRYVAARAILRSLIGAALDMPAAALVFEYGSHGKPALARIDNQPSELCFNVSHAEGLAIFALAWNRNMGIDLEAESRLGDPQKLDDLAVRVLSPRELSAWRALPDKATRRLAFLRAWTRKEAYVKATGEGLFNRLQAIEVALDAVTPEPSVRISTSTENEKTGRHWMVHDLFAPAGFVAAIAVEQLIGQQFLQLIEQLRVASGGVFSFQTCSTCSSKVKAQRRS
jgi:4'-phosphopantetheinyl transferase